MMEFETRSEKLKAMRDALKKQKRRETLARKAPMALAALRPCLEDLSVGPGEWQDSQAFYVEDRLRTGKKNEFVVEGDNMTTYQKALKFLLETPGTSLYQIASSLILGKCVEDADYDEVLWIVYDHLSEILASGKNK